jgi:hypothetical protein
VDVPAEEERGKSAQDHGPDENPRLIRSAQQHDDGWLCHRDSLKECGYGSPASPGRFGIRLKGKVLTKEAKRVQTNVVFGPMEGKT